MPTAAIFNFGGDRLIPLREPHLARVKVVQLKASTTFSKGTIVGEILASPGTFGAYASGNSDGTQLPIGVLTYACKTDSSKNISIGDTAGGEQGATQKGIGIYTSGVFATADLVGLDANAVSALGKLLTGTVSDGEVQIA